MGCRLGQIQNIFLYLAMQCKPPDCSVCECSKDSEPDSLLQVPVWLEKELHNAICEISFGLLLITLLHARNKQLVTILVFEWGSSVWYFFLVEDQIWVSDDKMHPLGFTFLILISFKVTVLIWTGWEWARDWLLRNKMLQITEWNAVISCAAHLATWWH